MLMLVLALEELEVTGLERLEESPTEQENSSTSCVSRRCFGSAISFPNLEEVSVGSHHIGVDGGACLFQHDESICQ